MTAPSPQQPSPRKRSPKPATAQQAAAQQARAQQAAARKARYLARALQINPLQQPDKLIRLRATFLGLDRPGAHQEQAQSPDNLQERRDRAAQVIDRIREKFWQMDLNTLRGNLASLKLQEFPELEHAATRLSVTASNRHLLPPLSQHKHFDSELFGAMKAVLICSPREVTGLKETLQRSLKDKRRCKQMSNMAKLLKRETPELYELERDWLDSIIAYRPAKQKAQRTEVYVDDDDDGFGCSSWLLWIAIFGALRVVIRLMANS